MNKRKLVECEDLAVHLSHLLCDETSVFIQKTVKAGIEYAFKDAPGCLSFLTCGVIDIVFNLPRAYFPEIMLCSLKDFQDRAEKIKTKTEEDPSGWCPLITLVDTLNEGLPHCSCTICQRRVARPYK